MREPNETAGPPLRARASNWGRCSKAWRRIQPRLTDRYLRSMRAWTISLGNFTVSICLSSKRRRTRLWKGRAAMCSLRIASRIRLHCWLSHLRLSKKLTEKEWRYSRNFATKQWLTLSRSLVASQTIPLPICLSRTVPSEDQLTPLTQEGSKKWQ